MKTGGASEVIRKHEAPILNPSIKMQAGHGGRSRPRAQLLMPLTMMKILAKTAASLNIHGMINGEKEAVVAKPAKHNDLKDGVRCVRILVPT